jgi:hypothetical protein
MIKIIKNCIDTKDIDYVNNYLASTKFNTKDDHVPLHDNLFNTSNNNFDITTYGDMGKEISFIFDKICKCIADATSEISGQQYGPPILTKSYIMKFNNYKELPLGFDPNRPDKVFRSLVFWNKSIDSLKLSFFGQNIVHDIFPGDIVVFPETEEFIRTVNNNTDFPIYISDFWNAPEGESPYPGLEYKDIAWGNPMYDKID